MRISRIYIQNFRSIREAEIRPTAFSLLVGKNNHGKTNMFEAISWFYSGKGDASEIRFAGGDAIENSEVAVEVEFCEVQAGVSNISNEDNRQKIKNVIGDNDPMKGGARGPTQKTDIFIIRI